LENLTDQLTALFEQAGKAHHQAYLAMNGDHPEWPIWYADYLLEKLPPLLGATFTRNELAGLLTRLSQEQAAEEPTDPWPCYYAHYFVEHYS
jgi:hypothetical protein